MKNKTDLFKNIKVAKGEPSSSCGGSKPCGGCLTHPNKTDRAKECQFCSKEHTDWEKEAQKWLDNLNMFDLEMVNNIVYNKLKDHKDCIPKKELAEMLKNEKLKTSKLKSRNPWKYILRRHAIIWRNELRKELKAKFNL